MGVDCMIFAKRAKRGVYLDRHYNVAWIRNLEEHSGDWWLGFLLGLDSAPDHEPTANMEANRKKAREFIEKNGTDDMYFVITDHHEPSFHEFAEAAGYKREDD